MQSKSPPKHVIFLGAGASFTSGYPLANGLRLRLAGDKQMQADLKLRYTDYPDAFNTVRKCFEDVKESVELFRHGGFGSVDEFSKLASLKYPKHVQAMKGLTRLALSLLNPEDSFHESDYYPFIQSLYDDKELHSLKPHITIVSYNYDCYLEYLLLKSQIRRNHLADVKEPDAVLKNRLSSGFYKPADQTSLNSLVEFHNLHLRHFKLHGSIHYAAAHLHKQLFENSIAERLKPFATQDFNVSTPPIVFPWELFDEGGSFVKQEDFIFVKSNSPSKPIQEWSVGGPDVRQQHTEAIVLYKLYEAIWQGAREAVKLADKISFVGMSMHPYLKQGLKYLFDGRDRAVEVVVANKANEHFKNVQVRLHPDSPCGRAAEMLKSVSPNMRFVGSSCEADGVFRMNDAFNLDDSTKEADYDITPRSSFAEFIEKEMD